MDKCKYETCAMYSDKDDVRCQQEQHQNKPKDKYQIIYYMFFILGLVHTLPWYFFTNATQYWMYKFRNTSITENNDPNYKTSLQVEFSPGITLSLQVSTVVFYLLGLFYGKKFSLNTKLFGSLGVFCSALLGATIFVFIDTDKWQTLFFGITMFLVVLISCSNAVFGLIMMEMAANFPKPYLGSCLAGVGVAMLFTAALQILSIAIGISIRGGALVYFWIATGTIAGCLLLLIYVVWRNPFYKYHMSEKNDKPKTSFDLKRILYLFKEVWPGGFLQLCTVLASTTVHPSITSLVVSENAGKNIWGDTYFVPVITFLLCAAMDYSGRILALKIKEVKPTYLMILSAVRIVFVPLLVFCNVHPRTHLPVVFAQDYQYIIIMLFFGISNGYIGANVYYIIPQLVHSDELEDALQLTIVIASICLGVFAFLPFVSVDIL